MQAVYVSFLQDSVKWETQFSISVKNAVKTGVAKETHAQIFVRKC